MGDFGANRIEVAGFVSPRLVPELADAEELLGELEGLDAGLAALVMNPTRSRSGLFTGIFEVNILVAAIDASCQRNERTSCRTWPNPIRLSACTCMTPGIPVWRNAVAGLAAGLTTMDATVAYAGGCPFAPSATGNVAISCISSHSWGSQRDWTCRGCGRAPRGWQDSTESNFPGPAASGRVPGVRALLIRRGCRLLAVGPACTARITCWCDLRWGPQQSRRLEGR